MGGLENQNKLFSLQLRIKAFTENVGRCRSINVAEQGATKAPRNSYVSLCSYVDTLQVRVKQLSERLGVLAEELESEKQVRCHPLVLH